MSNGLLKSIGVERTEGITTGSDGEEVIGKVFANSSVKGLALDDSEYEMLCQQLGMESDAGMTPEEIAACGGKKPNKKDILVRERIHTFRGSDESVDGMGDIIRVEGWDLERYQKNPVFLAQHESWDMPVGRAIRVWKETADPGAPNGKSLMFRIYFPMGVNEKVDAMHELYRSGILSSVSVGFRATQARSPQSEAERQALGLGKYGVEFQKQELLELSGVTIPANANAVKVKSLHEKTLCAKIGIPAEVDAGGVTASDIVAIKELIASTFGALTAEVKALREEVVQLKSAPAGIKSGDAEGATPNAAPVATTPSLDVFDLAKQLKLTPDQKE